MSTLLSTGRIRLTEANTKLIAEQIDTIDKQIKILQNSKKALWETFGTSYENYLRSRARLVKEWELED